MCSQHHDLQSLGVLEVIDGQEDSSIKLDNWPFLCHVLKGGSPRQDPVRHSQRNEQRLSRGHWCPEDGMEGSTPAYCPSALQAALFVCCFCFLSLCFQNMLCLLRFLVQKGFEAFGGWG